MANTPPPSPEVDDNKRRSARNTQRKKYTDDVMLRFSDDEMPDGQKKSDGSVNGDKKETGGPIGPNKPNFVYIVSSKSTNSTYELFKTFFPFWMKSFSPKLLLIKKFFISTEIK